MIKSLKHIFDPNINLIIQAVFYGILCIYAIFLMFGVLVLDFKKWKEKPLKYVLWIIGGYLIFSLVTSMATYPLYALGHEDYVNNDGVIAMSNQIGTFFAILVIGFFAPIVEEFFYRYLLVGKAKSKINVWVCVILSSVIFGLCHINEFTLVGLLGSLPFIATGLVYGCIYAKVENITIPIILHIINNASAIIILTLSQ
jgi:membrane protease YdiL (CAAX protease family)